MSTAPLDWDALAESIRHLTAQLREQHERLDRLFEAVGLAHEHDTEQRHRADDWLRRRGAK